MLEDLKLDPIYDGFLFLAESVRNPPSLRSHHHVELELNLVAQGSVTYVVCGKRIAFGAKSLLWLFPAQEHQLVHRTNDAQNYVAVFKPTLIAEACRSAAYRNLRRKNPGDSGVIQTVLDPESFDFMRRMMDRIMEGSLDADLLNRESGFGHASDFRYHHEDPEGLNAGLRYLLLLAWKLQLAGGAGSHPVALHPAVGRALAVLGDDSWSGQLGELARECGVSEAHLSRTFARQVGVPISRYRNSIRLARFWTCYHETAVHRTIMEAAFRAGFGSYAQFFKVFTEAYGQGPGTYLRSGSQSGD